MQQMQTTILAQINTLRQPSERSTMTAPMPALMAPPLTYMMPNSSASVPITTQHHEQLLSSHFMAHPRPGGTKQ